MKMRLLLLGFLCTAVFTDPIFTGISHAVKLQVVSDHIIRVIASPGKEIASTQSLVTDYNKRSDLSWSAVPSKENLFAIVGLKTGAISFRGPKGNKILGEKQPFERNFQTTADDAWYGLGQHQDGILNCRGQQVVFFQNNTEVAIPVWSQS